MTLVNSRRVLLTGFTAFGAVAVNPSQLIVERLAGCYPYVATAVLPVEYDGVRAALRDLLHVHQPEVVIGLGVAQGRRMISLERVAINLDDGSQPDNAGVLRQGQLIEADGPAAYWSTLPLDAMFAALQTEQIPVHYSNHAGAYLCNHLFYRARYATDGQGIPCGFVHIPGVDDTGEKGLPLETMLRGVEVVLQVVSQP